MGPHVDLHEAVEKVAPAHDAGVVGGDVDDGGVVAEEGPELMGQQATYMPMPSTRLMASWSLLPAYCLVRTEEPLWMPKHISWMTNTGMLARVTPASGPSPSTPTIKVSTRPRELVMIFWNRIGRARAMSFL